MSDQSLITQTSDFLLYHAPNGDVKIQVSLHDENLWLTQKDIADLFGTSKQNVSGHLKNIFESGELSENGVVKDFFTTASDQKKYKIISTISMPSLPLDIVSIHPKQPSFVSGQLGSSRNSS
ncbi:hypothetical protein MK079_03225 [Candidatus Gracilibacteria bacterium]|nr:hypothetical protein [Candidatus Gracilibacteria bacterium]